MTKRAPKAARAFTDDEIEFMNQVMLAVGCNPTFRIHRQNVGSVPIRDRTGKVVRYFHAGPPVGASDLSGIVRPEGWRLEIEMKSSTGTRSPEQIRWADHIVTFGGVYVLIAYDPGLTPKQNIAEATRLITFAIEARRSRSA